MSTFGVISWNRRRLAWGGCIGLLGIGNLLFLDLMLLPAYIESSKGTEPTGLPPSPIVLDHPESAATKAPSSAEVSDLKRVDAKTLSSAKVSDSKRVKALSSAEVSKTVDLARRGSPPRVRSEINPSHRGGRGARLARQEEGETIDVFNRRVTPPGGMDRPPNAGVIFDRAPNLHINETLPSPLWIPICRVHFGYDRWWLSRRKLISLFRCVRFKGNHNVALVVGHTDRRGDQDYNNKLGVRRASTVIRALKKMRFPEEQILRGVSLGSRHPLTSGTSFADRARNRRVDVYLLPSSSVAKHPTQRSR